MKSLHVALLAAGLALTMTNSAQAEPVFVPNADFGLPVVTNLAIDVATNMIDWGTFPPYPYDEGGIGVFANFPGDGEFIVNGIGPQAAYIFNDVGLALFQDFASTDSTGSDSNLFTATYEAGRIYRLKAGFIGSTNFGEPVGASLQMSLYYRDASDNMVTVASTNIVYTADVFTSITNFVAFELDSPPTQPGDPWAGQHIGIQFLPGSATNLEGGYWDVGNIQLFSSIYVPNADFSLPLVTNFDTDVATNMADWGTFPPYPYDQGAIGVFANLPDDGEFITNDIGTQAAYIFNDNGLALFQDYEGMDSTGAASTNFSATYDIGKSYRLRAGIIGSINFGEPPGATLQMSLYYRDASSDMVTIAATNITYTTNVFISDTNFLDFELDTPTVRASDPWAGRHIGIQFLAYDANTNLQGGFWDVGKIQLDESLTPVLTNPGLTNGQFEATLQSDPGRVFQILATTNLSTPASWTTLTTLTNITGMTLFTDSTTNTARFYRAEQAPP